MEIELKYLIDDEFTKDRIFNDSHLREIADEETIETIPMKAIYFDTGDKSLMRKEMAFRVRFEGERPVATLKWGGGSENGLHVRGELNVTVNDEFLEKPDMEIFQGSSIYDEISKAVDGKVLHPVMEMDFIRKQVQLDTGKSISVISYDKGEIKTIEGEAPISELEIELYSGDQEDIIALGKELEQKYNLVPGNKSKYQRGMELLGIDL